MTARFINARSVRVDGLEIPGSPSAARVERSVARVLDNTVLCAWATVTEGGHAHINTAYFAWSAALELYFLSHPRSLHCRNIVANPSMAVAVFASSQNWTEPGRGLQLFGTCHEVTGAHAAEAEREYAQRFEAYVGWSAQLKADDPGRDYRLYRFVPHRVKILDESEFGDAVFVLADIVRTE